MVTNKTSWLFFTAMTFCLSSLSVREDSLPTLEEETHLGVLIPKGDVYRQSSQRLKPIPVPAPRPPARRG